MTSNIELLSNSEYFTIGTNNNLTEILANIVKIGSDTSNVTLSVPQDISSSYNLILPVRQGASGESLVYGADGQLVWHDPTVLKQVVSVYGSNLLSSLVSAGTQDNPTYLNNYIASIDPKSNNSKIFVQFKINYHAALSASNQISFYIKKTHDSNETIFSETLFGPYNAAGGYTGQYISNLIDQPSSTNTITYQLGYKVNGYVSIDDVVGILGFDSSYNNSILLQEFEGSGTNAISVWNKGSDSNGLYYNDGTVHIGSNKNALDSINTPGVALELSGNLLGNNATFIGNIYANNIVSDLIGNVTGNLTGNVTGNLTGNVTGNLTGNVFGVVTGTVSSLSNHTTDDLAESSTNKYYTDVKVVNKINSHLTGGTGITYNNGSISIGQSVGTNDDVQFNNVTIDGTLNSDDITGTNVTVSNDLVVSGNLTVNGTRTIVNATTLDIGDNKIVVNASGSTSDAGITANVNGIEHEFIYSINNNAWGTTGDLNIAGTITGSTFVGDLSGNINTVTIATSNLNLNGTLATSGTTKIEGNLIPKTNVTYDLGSSTHMWRDVYVGPGSLYVNNKKVIEDNSDTINITTDEGQNLKIKTSGAGGQLQIQSAEGGINMSKTGNTGDITITTTSGGDINLNSHDNIQITATDDIQLTSTTGTIQLKSSVNITNGMTVSNPTGDDIKIDDNLQITGQVKTNEIIEYAINTGVTIENVLIKDDNVTGNLTGSITMTGHILPDTNSIYDIGSAEYKIRDLYLSNNSLWVGDENKITVNPTTNEIQFKRRKTNTIPQSFLAQGKNNESEIVNAVGVSSLPNMTLSKWKEAAILLNIPINGKNGSDIDTNYIFDVNESNDWESSINTNLLSNQISILEDKVGQSLGITDNVRFNNVTIDGTLNSDDITGTNVTVSNDLVVSGNLTVNGTRTIVNATTLDIGDNKIVVNASGSTSDAGITANVNGIEHEFIYSINNNAWGTSGNLNIGNNITASGALTIDTINENSTNNGVIIEGLTLKDNILNAHTITASNYNVGSKNIISASGQGSFTDLELKNNNGTKLLIDGDTGNITALGALTIDGDINAANNVTASYFIGDGSQLTGVNPSQQVSLAGEGATTITGAYPNFTISSTDTNTTYSAGAGISINGTTITNNAPDQTVTLTGEGATTVSGTYPNFTISSTNSSGVFYLGNPLYNSAGQYGVARVDFANGSSLAFQASSYGDSIPNYLDMMFTHPGLQIGAVENGGWQGGQLLGLNAGTGRWEIYDIGLNSGIALYPSSDDRIKTNEEIFTGETYINYVKQIVPKKYKKYGVILTEEEEEILEADGDPFADKRTGKPEKDYYYNPKIEYGVIAQDIHKIPGLEDIVSVGDDNNMWSIDYRSLDTITLGAVKGLIDKIENLEARINTLENK